MKPKILVFAGFFHPHKGGSEQFILNLCNFLANKGFECSIITCNTEQVKQFEKLGKIQVFRVDSWVFVGKKFPVPKPWSMIKTLRNISRSQKFGCIFTNTRFFNICFYAPWFKWFCNPKAKLVHIEHGTKHTDNESLIVYAINFLYDYTFGLFIMLSANFLFGISKKSQKFIRKISGKSSGLVRNCIDVSAFKKSSSNLDELRKKYSVENEFVVCFAGRLIEAKGVQDLMAACENIKETKLIILGSGDYENELKKLAKNKNVVFVNRFYNRKLLLEVLSISNVFVNPSYNEGLPTSVLEAGAFGLPVIATDVGGTSEIIDHGKNGFLVEPKKPSVLKKFIKKLKQDKSLRKAFAKKLNQKIKKEFDTTTAFLPLLKILKKGKK